MTSHTLSHMRVPYASPDCDSYGRTDGRTNEESWLSTRDIRPYVTHARTYGDFPMTPAATYREAQILLAIIGPDPDAARHMRDLEQAVGLRCIIAGCGRRTKAGRMCDTHYRAHRRAVANEAHLINRKAAA